MKHLTNGALALCLGALLLFLITSVTTSTIVKNDVDEALASATKEAVDDALLSSSYSIEEQQEFVDDVNQRISKSIENDYPVQVEVIKADEKRGILKIRVTQDFKYPNGTNGKAQAEATAVFDQSYDKKEYSLKFLNYLKDDISTIEDESLFIPSSEYLKTYPDMLYKQYSVSAGQYPVAPTTNPKRDKFVFQKWVDEDGNTLDLHAKVTKNMVYRPVYGDDLKGYDIIFDGNGATSGEMTNQHRKYGDNKALSPNNYSNKYVVHFHANGGKLKNNAAEEVALDLPFLGWSTTSDSKTQFQDQTTEDITKMDNTTVTLYAIWNKEKAKITLPAAEKEGLEFKGWYQFNGEDDTEGTLVGKAGDTCIVLGTANVYAVYGEIPESHTITFDVNGADKEIEPIKVLGDVDVLFPTPTKEGYEFEGWEAETYVDDEGIIHEDVYDGGETYTVYSDLHLKAKWKKGEYSTTFNANKGFFEDGEEELTEYNEYGSKGHMPKVYRDGYEFTGWYTKVKNGEKIGNDGDEYTQKKTEVIYYAGWKPLQYKLTIIVDEEREDKNIERMVDNDTKIVIDDLTRTGYSFSHLELEDGNATISNKNAVTIEGSDVIVRAVWEPHVYHIKYIAKPDDGKEPEGIQTGPYEITGEMEDDTYYYDDAFLLQENQFNHPAYEFKGWTTNRDDLNTVMYENMEPMKAMTDEDEKTIILYAVWEPKTFELTLDLQGGIASDDKITYQIPYLTEVSIPQPTRTNYDFMGWELIKEEGTSEGAEYDADTNTFTMGYSNAILRAKWRARYTITCDLVGGTTSETIPSTYSVDDDDITLITPTRDCFEFLGWTGSNGSTPQKTVIIPKGSTGNKTYTANWQEKRIIATVHPYEGTVDGNAHTGSVTTNISDCTIRYGTSSGNYDLTSPPTFTTRGRNVFYFKATKDGWISAEGQVAVVLRNPNMTSKSVVIEKGNGAFDVKGNGGSIQTTYADCGYFNYVKIDGGAHQSMGGTNGTNNTFGDITVTRTTSVTNEYGYVRTTYTITNNSSTSHTVGVGFGCDADLNGDDHVPCTVTSTGLESSSGGYTFAYYTRNFDGVDNCDGLGVGQFPPFRDGSNIWSMMSIGSSFSGDSGLGASWTRTVPAHSTITISWGLDML